MRLKTPHVGQVVVSTQGRDCGKFYIVVEVAPSCVYLSDGKVRPMAAPKKKNIRHIRLLNVSCTDIGVKSPFDGSFDAGAAHGLKKLTDQVQSEE